MRVRAYAKSGNGSSRWSSCVCLWQLQILFNVVYSYLVIFMNALCVSGSTVGYLSSSSSYVIKVQIRRHTDR
jgi:hypothetical protein